MAIDKVLSSSIANGAVTAALISNTANLVVSSLTANVITITTISGSANVTGDMTVGGNLTISGTTTYVNTTDLNIGDAIISLNADLAANVSPTEDAGISINRGASTNAQFKWIESTDNWSLGNTSIDGTLTTTSNTVTLGTAAYVVANGNVGVGTSSPANKFTVKPSASSSGTIDFLTGSSNSDSVRISGGGTVNTWLELRGYLGVKLYSDTTNTLTVDSNGNLGLGATPSGWGIFKSIELPGGVHIGAYTGSSNVFIGGNSYYNGSSWVYKATGAAARYQANAYDGSHTWYSAASGTGGANVSFTQAMTLDASGNLGIGTISPGDRLHAVAAVAAGLSLQASGTGGSTWRILSTDNAASLGGGYLGFNNGSYRMVLDSSGNLGLGVTPSASNASKSLEMPNGSTLFARSAAPQFGLMVNAVGNWYEATYKTTAAANMYLLASGQHQWYNAASGTAGNTISFTQAMTLDASGNLVIGNTTAWGRLHVTKSVNNTATAATNISDYQNATFILHNQDEAGTGNKAGMFFAFAGSPGILAGMDGYKVSGNWNTGLRWYTNNSTGVNVGNFTEKMRMDPDGNLGVGTASPASRFTVEPQSDTSNAITFRKTGQTSFGTLMAYADANGPSYAFGSNYSSTSAGSVSRANTSYAAWSIAMDCRPTNTAMVFDYISSSGTYSERMRINSSGYVGIGTSSPTTPLSVVGMANFGGVLMGSPLNTTNDNSGCVMLHKLGQSGGYQFSGHIVANSWTGNAMIDVNIIVDYTNDSVYYQVLSASTLNSGSSTKTTLQLVKVTYGGFSYLGIRKNGGGTGTIYLNGATQCNVPYPFEIASGSYTVTSTLGTLN